MKLWEVIKALTEDPTKVYEAQMQSKDWTVRMTVDTGFSRYFKFEVFNGARLIDQSHDGGAFNGNVAVDLDWQLVRQPVTWQEAIQAWSEGSDIKECFPRSERLYRSGDTIHLNENDVLNGTWYVED